MNYMTVLINHWIRIIVCILKTSKLEVDPLRRTKIRTSAKNHDNQIRRRVAHRHATVLLMSSSSVIAKIRQLAEFIGNGVGQEDSSVGSYLNTKNHGAETFLTKKITGSILFST